MSKTLQYAPYTSALDAGFWHKLSQLKLDVFCLNDEPQLLNGFYVNSDPTGLPCRLNVDYTAFNQPHKTPPRSFPSHGVLKNTNTIDEFKTCDKKALLDVQGTQLWEDIISGRAIQDPSLLSRFFVLTHADLKKYHYFYWFAFPALTSPESVQITREPLSIQNRFSQEQIECLLKSYDTFCIDHHVGYFLIHESDGFLKAEPLSSIEQLIGKGKILLGICDPCTLDMHPGWPLRNLITLAAVHWSSMLQEVEILCMRDRTMDGKRDVSHSIVLKVAVPKVDSKQDCPRCVGWEKNEKQKLGPRMVNLSSSMDPTRLAESAVDLNLKLMRWRLLPELNLDRVAQSKCLLLGAGTLGCNVARCLLGWGVRNITLVDNGKISYSNPVRQSLFMFKDSLGGGQPKAETAAEALKLIFPGVNAVGLSLSIPMPGHSVPESAMEQTQKDVIELDELVSNHDVIFLLMDTRESRWLPTVIAASKRKIVINAALGFDTFLVVRHGVKVASSAMETDSDPGAYRLSDTVHGRDLGCYFCNDVVAPGDVRSTRDRTLDQQCTVSRPGMSMMTAALAVELLVSLLQHPEGTNAPADTSARDEHLTKDTDSPLGLVPHQIRGFLSRYHTVLPACRAFDKCTACSKVVIDQYEKEKFDFLIKVFNHPGFLEDLTGLSKLHAETLDSEVWALSDDEDDGEMT